MLWGTCARCGSGWTAGKCFRRYGAKEGKQAGAPAEEREKQAEGLWAAVCRAEGESGVWRMQSGERRACRLDCRRLPVRSHRKILRKPAKLTGKWRVGPLCFQDSGCTIPNKNGETAGRLGRPGMRRRPPAALRRDTSSGKGRIRWTGSGTCSSSQLCFRGS